MSSIGPGSWNNPVSDVSTGEVPLEVASRSLLARRSEWKSRSSNRTWLSALEDVLTGWPTTLRVSLLLAIMLVGAAVIGFATFGAGGVLLLPGLALVARRPGNRNIRVRR